MTPPTHHDFDFLLQEMHRIHKETREDLKTIRHEQAVLGKEVAGLKVKAGFWGGIAGMIPVALAGCWIFVKHIVGGEVQ